MNPKENPNNGIFLLPFSPLKKQSVYRVAVPMFPNHECAIKFNPPVSVFRQRHHFECEGRMAELLSRLPDYEQFQPEIIRSIYVAHQSPKRKSYHTTTKNSQATTGT